MAIDNGSCLSSKAYDTVPSLQGPMVSYTVEAEGDYTQGGHQPSTITEDIPEWIIQKLRSGIGRKADFDVSLFSPPIPYPEFLNMWYRAEELVRAGCFLSRFNRAHALGE